MIKLRLLSILLLFFLFYTNNILACGYNFVSSCNTILTLEADGNPTSFYADNCGYLTSFEGHNLGAIGALVLTYGEVVTWESCENEVITARIYYRIYATGNTPGSFSIYELDNLNQLTSGVYRTKKHTSTISIDLGGTLNQGTYTMEVYFEADVDINNDGIADASMQKNNSGNNYKANFTFTNGGTGDLSVNFTDKKDITCNGGNDGKVTATSSNGAAPLSFAWSNSTTNAIASNLVADSYLVVVTDANGLTGAANVVITEPSVLIVNASSTDATSSSSMNGTATAAPVGGTPPYSYLWSNDGTSQTITNLNIGSYTVDVTDANGCVESESVLIVVDTGAPLVYCNASSDFPWVDWVSRVQLEQIDRTSQKAPYNDYTDDFAELEQGESYTIDLGTSYSWTTYDEYFRVWIDFNRDGIFQEPDEIAFSQVLTAPSSFGQSGNINGDIIVPSDAELGLVRMRVIMTRDAYASPCGTIPNGEVEDYSINIMEGTNVPTCSIATTTVVGSCDDAGTDSNPSDDTYTFDLTATAVNGESSWTSTIDGQAENGTYGVNQTFGSYLISDGNLSFSLQDDTNLSCTENVTIIPPATCSDVIPCNIDGSITNVLCNDEGTNNNSADDTYIFDLLVTGVSTGSGWSAIINGSLVNGMYNVAENIGPFLISDGIQNFTLIDNENSGCSSNESVNPPASCSTPPPPCNFNSTISNVLCSDSGTNMDSSDDTFSFDLLVSGTNTGANGWTTTINGAVVSGAYGLVQNLGDYLISEGDLMFTVVDVDGNSCATVVSVTAPSSCSNPQPCAINANASIGICDDNGTANDPSDDTYSFDLTITGSSTGSGWTADVNGSIFNGNYGEVVPIGDFPISNGGVTAFIQDNNSGPCTTNAAVSAPSTCSNPTSPANYCVSSSAFPWHDWISNISVGDLDKNSGKSPYSGFTADEANLVTGQTSPVALTASFSWFTYEEYWKVWIDYNQNGIFEEPGELAFSVTQVAPPNGTLDEITTGSITVPMTALLGSTRMRVSMKRDAASGSCEILPYGEVEDYTVNITATAAPLIVSNLILDLQTTTDFEAVDLYWLLKDQDEISSMVLEKSTDGLDFQSIIEVPYEDGQQLFNTIDENPLEGDNFYRVKINYPSGGLRYSNIEANRFEAVLDYEIFPNPAKNSTRLKLEQFMGENVAISILNNFGKPVFEQQFSKLDNPILNIDLSNFREGSYFIWVKVEGHRAKAKKLMVMKF